MKLYYQDELVTLYNGDCREIGDLGEINADLILTDPPYQQSDAGGGFIGKRASYQLIGATLSSFAPGDFLELLLKRTKRAHGYFFCSKDLVPVYANWFIAAGLTWDLFTVAKTNPTPLKNNCYLPDAEYLMFVREPGGGCFFNVDCPFDDYRRVKTRTAVRSAYGHPTEKPIHLLKSLLRVSSFTGQLVLDPFAGSGTTLAACKLLHRRAIGIEIEEKYCEMAAKRCAQGVMPF